MGKLTKNVFRKSLESFEESGTSSSPTSEKARCNSSRYQDGCKTI